jgi:hypothetical protein
MTVSWVTLIASGLSQAGMAWTGDREVTLIGEQIAAVGALSDLAGKLLHATATSIEA